MKIKTIIAAAAVITAAAFVVNAQSTEPAVKTASAPAATKSTTTEITKAPELPSTGGEVTTSSKPSTEEVTTPAAQATEPNTIKVKGETIAFKNTSQEELQGFINANPDMAGTYYGSAFSGTDGVPTHFAGHDYGKMGIIQQAVVGDEIVITDEAGTEFTYVVTETYLATATFTGGEAYLTSQSDVDFITRQMNETTEMVYLQTCASPVENGNFDVFYVVAMPK